MRKIILNMLLSAAVCSALTVTAVWICGKSWWLILPVFVIWTVIITWRWSIQFDREWKQAKLEHTVHDGITREQIRRLTGCQSVEEFSLVCAAMMLDDELLMKSYPFLRWT